MELKKPLPYPKQVERLIEHNMIVDNKDYATQVLSKINYYRFSGCALQYRKSENDSDFIENTSFDKVLRIYRFDESLRNIIRKYIEIAEVYYRTQIAHGFALQKCINPPYDQHYSDSNFYNKKAYNKIKEKFGNQKSYYYDNPVMKHHQTNYGNKFPLWVITEMIPFSDLSKLYNSMYNSEKDVIASSVGTGRKILANHLHCLSVLRNKAAHAARLYNTSYRPPVIFSTEFLRKNPEVKNDSLFAYLLALTKRLPDEETKNQLISEIDSIICEYSDVIDMQMIGFPVNYLDILKTNKW